MRSYIILCSLLKLPYTINVHHDKLLFHLMFHIQYIKNMYKEYSHKSTEAYYLLLDLVHSSIKIQQKNIIIIILLFITKNGFSL